MADFDGLWKISKNQGFLGRIAWAIVVAADAIKNEDPGVENHANRLIWANEAISDPYSKAQEMTYMVLLNATIASDPLGATDDDISFTVNSLVDTFATGS